MKYFTNRDTIVKAMAAFAAYANTHDTVPTPLGPANPQMGAFITNIRMLCDWNFVQLEVNMLDRSIREKDDIRMGDTAYFVYDIALDKIFTAEEYEEECKKREEEYEKDL